MKHIYENTKTIKYAIPDNNYGTYEIPLVHVLAEGQVININWGKEDIIEGI